MAEPLPDPQQPSRGEPGREHLPHLAPLEFSNQTILVFVSCNVASRRPLLCRQDIHQLLINSWNTAGHWLVGHYVLMPDHLHFFCAPYQQPRTPLKRWMEFWRADVTRRWPYPDEKPVWQKDFFDRQLRTGESYTQKWHYLRRNPVEAGLALRSEDWPYQGELNQLTWHEPS